MADRTKRGRGSLAGLACAALISLTSTITDAAAPPDLCRDAASVAARSTGVPLAVLMAISLTETGRTIDGTPAPWPWTLNLGGRGVWADSRQAALAEARAAQQSGRRNFDVGCFQINYRWHGDAFASLDAMMEPRANALYAAQFLADLFAESGDWSVAAGHYHSRTPEHATRYRRIFDTHLAALGSPRHRGAPIPANGYPLLRAGGQSTGPGSLVPRSMGAGVGLLTGASGPFWGDG